MAPAKLTTEKDYDDIPGTYVFDADRSRRGYHLNMFCMSLMKAENRKAFKDDEPKYLDKNFPQLSRRSSSASTTGCSNWAATSISPPSSEPPTAIRSSISPR
jgi:hypothetical protein